MNCVNLDANHHNPAESFLIPMKSMVPLYNMAPSQMEMVVALSGSRWGLKDGQSSVISNISQRQIREPHVSVEEMIVKGQRRFGEGAYGEVVQICQQLLRDHPNRQDVFELLAAAHYLLGNYDACININRTLAHLNPDSPDTYQNLANAYRSKGDDETAMLYFSKVVQLVPACSQALNALGRIYARKGLARQAVDSFQQAITHDPHYCEAFWNLAALLRSMGMSKEALSYLTQAAKAKPQFPQTWFQLAQIYGDTSEFTSMNVCFQEACRLDPSYLQLASSLPAAPPSQSSWQGVGRVVTVDSSGGSFGIVSPSASCAALIQTPMDNSQAAANTFFNVGNQYAMRRMYPEAHRCYVQAIQVSSGFTPAYSALAGVLKQQGRHQDALTIYHQAFFLNPLAIDISSERAALMKDLGYMQDAVNAYAQAINLHPHVPELYANLASVFKDGGHHDQAITNYMQALHLRSDFPDALCNFVHSLQCVCDWRNRRDYFARLEATVRQQIANNEQPSVQPFHAIAYPVGGELALEISKMYAEKVSLNAMSFNLPPFDHVLAKRWKKGDRIRLGYVSSDFGNHPLSHLMGSVFGLHNRSDIEVFCYALSASDDSEWRRRIEKEAEHFRDVSSETVPSIAQIIHNDGIQILVNLNGYTKGARNEIFALRPAPVQVSYMGFPSTTGADYIHYLVTDKIVSPPEYAHFYSEKLVYVPNCYFVNDYKQRHRDVLDVGKLPSRSSVGLPEKGIIYACFNQLYKMDPEILDCWCEILSTVPNSYLWLLRFPPSGEARLRTEAESRGVAREKIIFTDVAAKHDHIRRSALADIFLDTPLCNAHTTGTDVLWAGCPIVTMPLQKMATRVAASLNYAAGIGELVCNDLQEYKITAIDLGRNPQRLQSLQRRLQNGRMTAPLFDTQRWVMNFDKAFLKMWQRYCDQQCFASFEITES